MYLPLPLPGAPNIQKHGRFAALMFSTEGSYMKYANYVECIEFQSCEIVFYTYCSTCGHLMTLTNFINGFKLGNFFNFLQRNFFSNSDELTDFHIKFVHIISHCQKFIMAINNLGFKVCMTGYLLIPKYVIFRHHFVLKRTAFLCCCAQHQRISHQ